MNTHEFAKKIVQEILQEVHVSVSKEKWNNLVAFVEAQLQQNNANIQFWR